MVKLLPVVVLSLLRLFVAVAHAQEESETLTTEDANPTSDLPPPSTNSDPPPPSTTSDLPPLSTFLVYPSGTNSDYPPVTTPEVPPPLPNSTEISSLPARANLTTVQIYNQVSQTVENVTYYANSFGEAVYDDDIIWGSESLLLSWRVENGVPSKNKRWYAVKPTYGWTTFPIPYRYDSAATRTLLKPYVDDALAKWQSLAPYLSFVERDPDPTFVPDTVVITSSPSDHCQSTLAFELGSFTRPHINLHSGCLGRQPKHEWGHQLGLLHEHKRPDRNDWVNFDCNAVQPECGTDNCCTDPPPPCCANLIYQFKVDTDTSRYQIGTAYDFESIMDYPGWAFARTGQNTLTRRSDGTPYPYNTEISAGDVQGVCAIYQSSCSATPATPPCGTCNPTAGLNKCDITTSCITTGTGPSAHHYCACRAGFKATTATDPSKQFRLSMPGQEYRVFVPENTPCNELCDYPHGFSPLLCSEVALQNTCPL